MKIKQLASNMTELQSGDTRILFSYETPVAAYIVNQGLYRTSKKWSVTTSKHIGKWDMARWSDYPYQEQTQEWFDALLEGCSAFIPSVVSNPELFKKVA